jgi:hypothetical protein
MNGCIDLAVAAFAFGFSLANIMHIVFARRTPR